MSAYPGTFGPVMVSVSFGPARTPSDDIVDKLRERKREIDRKLGDEAVKLRAELRQIEASLKAFDSAKPKAKKGGSK